MTARTGPVDVPSPPGRPFNGRIKMRAFFQGSLFSAACLGFAMPLASARPDEKKEVVEFRRAETKPADGLAEAVIAGTTQKVYIPKNADATSSDIAEAKATLDPGGSPAIEIVFTKEGAKKMAALTERHLDKPLAILINGKVVSAPVVRVKLLERAQIQGTFTQEEIERLVKAINER
jgi:preprotein translocase subunit SecD